MRAFLITSVMVTLLMGLAFAAADIDRHADYTDPAAGANARAQCRSFTKLDDNRTPCNDFCASWNKDHPGATCNCSEDKCPAEQGQPPKP